MHTCLSPCAEIDMTPREIVAVSLERGLNLIAITDHNSAENIEATKKVAEGTGLMVLAGMEITSSEEVHILALFEYTDHARLMQNIVYENLPSVENDEKLYGNQLIVNENNEIMGFNKRLLIAATSLNTHAILDLIDSFGGLSIASHIDRDAFSVLSQLGFIPEDLKFDAIEMSPRISRDKAETMFKELKRFPWVSFSDAHHVNDIGRRTTAFTMKELTFHEIKQAFDNSSDRDLFWD